MHICFQLIILKLEKFCSHTVHDEIHGVHLHQYRNPIALILLILQYGVVQRQTVLLIRDGEDLGKVTVAPEKQIRPGQVAVMTKVKEQQILRHGVLLLLRIAGVLSLTEMVADGVEVAVGVDGVEVEVGMDGVEVEVGGVFHLPVIRHRQRRTQTTRRIASGVGVDGLPRLPTTNHLRRTQTTRRIMDGVGVDGVLRLPMINHLQRMQTMRRIMDGVGVDGEPRLPMINHLRRMQTTRRIMDGVGVDGARLPMINHLQGRTRTARRIRVTRQKVAGPDPAAYKLHQPGAQEHYSTTMLKTNKLGATRVLLLT